MSRPTAAWATPDPARGPGAPAGLDASPGYGTPPSARPSPGTGARADVRAGVVTAVALVLLGAPAGLLWAAVAPKVTVVLSGQSVMLVNPDRSAFIAGDGAFLAVVFSVGLVSGALTWAFGRRHGPAAVVGLTAGGLLAAYVASRTGALLDATAAQDAVDAGRSGAVDLALRLRASEAMIGWPVGALLGFLVPSLLRGE